MRKMMKLWAVLLLCFCCLATVQNAEARRHRSHASISIGTEVRTKIGGITIGTSIRLPVTEGEAGEQTEQQAQPAKQAKEPNAVWQELLARYQAEEQVRQLIFVRHTTGSNALVELYAKEKDKWRLVHGCTAILGENGLGKSKEGDNKTPLGDYGITMAMGFKPNPGTKAKYLQMNEHTFCSEDPSYYNLLLDDREVEDLPQDVDYMNAVSGPFFNYCLFVDYNKERIPGKGSYIFMHCGRELYDETHGCIALLENDMKKILKQVDDNVRICIFPW